MKKFKFNTGITILVLIFCFFNQIANAETYYISSSSGNDTSSGLSPEHPFKTIDKANTLNLNAGDKVLFKCGDIWKKEMLKISQSGTLANPVVFGSYPENCNNKPIISGSLPITNWVQYSGNTNLYYSELSTGDNRNRFLVGNTVYGINQLFKNNERLAFGRWPNIGSNNNGGYSSIDLQNSGTIITDAELPSGTNWTGAYVHLKNRRWSIVNREIIANSGTTLTLNSGVNCLGGCKGWGYFINNHLSTLDMDGEWYFDKNSLRVYLYSSQGSPENIEGSIILGEDTRSFGGIILGGPNPINHVIIKNFEINNFFAQGITMPAGMSGDAISNVKILNNKILNIDDTGIKLDTWIERPGAGTGQKGKRGGSYLEINENIINGANHFGIDLYSRNSSFNSNTIINIGLIENLNKSGMGGSLTASQSTENGNGIRNRCFHEENSGFGNTFKYNKIKRTAYNGIDMFGSNMLIQYNVFDENCYAKGDGGAIRTFGTTNLSSTEVHDIDIFDNIIMNIIGNTDGTNNTYKPLYGKGIYIDHFSRNINVLRNTIFNTTIAAISFSKSTGKIEHNIAYDCSNNGQMFSSIMGVYNAGAYVTSFRNNVMYGFDSKSWTLGTDDHSKLHNCDYNFLFNPFDSTHILTSTTTWTQRTFEDWQSYSGKDAHSKTNWFSLQTGDERLSRIFYNDTKNVKVINLGTVGYYDLNKNQVNGTITLQPFSSIVLIKNTNFLLSPTGLKIVK